MRTQQKIPLEAVADEICVSCWQLTLIEAEDHAQMPDPVFVKGILKAYAKFIGVDEDDIVERYLINRSFFLNNKENDSEPYHKKFFYHFCIGAAFLVIIIVLSIFMIYGFQTSQPDQTGLPATETLKDQKPNAINGSESETFLPADNGKLFLQIDARDETWIKMVCDGGQPQEYLLNPLDHIEIEASSKINMLVGNATGVTMKLNGKPVNIPGKKGDVVNIELPR